MKSSISVYIILLFCFAHTSIIAQTETISLSNTVGGVAYESKDHRSNVYEVVSDIKTINNNQFQGIIIAATDYYPYGSEIPTRSLSEAEAYKYGFQGQEKDEEVKGKGNSINYKHRMHDTRLGRFFAVDPLAAKYPHYSSYQFSGNKTTAYVELEGLEEGEITDSKEKGNEDDFLNGEGNRIDIHLKEFSVSPDEEPEREILRYKRKIIYRDSITYISLKNKIKNLFRHPSRRRINVIQSIDTILIPVYKPILVGPRQISREINESGELNGQSSRVLNYNSPSDARSLVNYTIDFNGWGGEAPNRFIIRDLSGAVINSGGNLQKGQENNRGILNFTVPSNTNFTIEIQGIDNPDANDVYEFKLNYSYIKN